MSQTWDAEEKKQMWFLTGALEVQEFTSSCLWFSYKRIVFYVQPHKSWFFTIKAVWSMMEPMIWVGQMRDLRWIIAAMKPCRRNMRYSWKPRNGPIRSSPPKTRSSNFFSNATENGTKNCHQKYWHKNSKGSHELDGRDTVNSFSFFC